MLFTTTNTSYGGDMVYMKGKQRHGDNMNEMFVQALYTEDMALLKTIVEGLKHVRLNHLKSMLIPKGELGGFTAFEFACLQGNASLASMLIDTGKVDVNRTGQFGWTPLHAAAYSGDLRTIQVLVNSCADCYARDEHNNLPVDLSRNDGVRSMLYKTMREKNLVKFNAILSEQSSRNESSSIDGIEQHQQKQQLQQQKRSKSCLANISLIKMNELQTQLIERKQSSSELNHQEFGHMLDNQIKRWKTCSDLTSLENIIFDMIC